jgi:hypothetical protein
MPAGFPSPDISDAALLPYTRHGGIPCRRDIGVRGFRLRNGGCASSSSARHGSRKSEEREPPPPPLFRQPDSYECHAKRRCRVAYGASFSTSLSTTNRSIWILGSEFGRCIAHPTNRGAPDFFPHPPGRGVEKASANGLRSLSTPRDVMLHLSHNIGDLVKGNSGRIVIEVDPDLKRRLHSALALENMTLKQWFTEVAQQRISTQVETNSPTRRAKSKKTRLPESSRHELHQK